MLQRHTILNYTFIALTVVCDTSAIRFLEIVESSFIDTIMAELHSLEHRFESISVQDENHNTHSSTYNSQHKAMVRHIRSHFDSHLLIFHAELTKYWSTHGFAGFISRTEPNEATITEDCR
jgi:hypothetical protein